MSESDFKLLLNSRKTKTLNFKKESSKNIILISKFSTSWKLHFLPRFESDFGLLFNLAVCSLFWYEFIRVKELVDGSGTNLDSWLNQLFEVLVFLFYCLWVLHFVLYELLKYLICWNLVVHQFLFKLFFPGFGFRLNLLLLYIFLLFFNEIFLVLVELFIFTLTNLILLFFLRVLNFIDLKIIFLIRNLFPFSYIYGSLWIHFNFVLAYFFQVLPFLFLLLWQYIPLRWFI